MKQENIYDKSLPEYSSVDNILNHFMIQEEQLEDILVKMNKNHRLSYIYYYGINQPKLMLRDISEMIQCSENVVKIYINEADEFIQRNCHISISEAELNNKRDINKKKMSFFDYFDEKDRGFVLQLIEEQKQKKSIQYKVLVKEYGEHYDCLVVPSLLTKKEKIQLNNFRASIRNRIKNSNSAKKAESMKHQSFFDYFDKKDHALVLEIIEQYKKIDHDYYKVLVKEYGETYDCLVVPSLLTKQKKAQLSNFRARIRDRLQNDNLRMKPIKQQTATKKSSFLDYFDQKDKTIVLEVIEEYKKMNHDYYKVLVKEYGETYDCLVVPSLLTKQESIQLNNFRARIKKRVQNSKLPKPPIKNNSFFDYFDQKDKTIVLEVIEEYKKMNHDYYKVLVKEYGETYDCLVVPSLLTSKEKAQLKNLKSNIKYRIKYYDSLKKSGGIKKSSFLDYFDQKDRKSVLKIIGEYKKVNHKYYKVLVKEYGETYDHFVYPSTLTKKEISLLNSFKTIIKTRLRSNNLNPLNQQRKTRKSSFFDYFDKKDHTSVLEIIEKYRKKNSNYYKLLVKEYGETYDCLVVSSLLNNKEKNQLRNFIQTIRNKLYSNEVKKNEIKTSKSNRKQSFFDYFDEKDKGFVLEIIEKYKKVNHDYYRILVKEYGKHYDCLVVPSVLTEYEKKRLNYFIKNIKNKIKNNDWIIRPQKFKKRSFFDYFDEKDKDFALEIIEDYKKIDHVYYKVLVKEFGKNYDHLVEPSLLTDLEKIYLENFRIDIVHKIHEKKATLVSNQKQSFFDYFDQKDYDSVLKIIEEYKKLNHEDYKLLVREYGEHYDCLVVPSPLNDKEKIQLSNFKMTIKEKLQNDNLSINSVKNETQNLQDKNFNCNLSMSYIYRRFPNLKQEKESDLIILTSFIDRKKSVESISNLTKFSIKKIDFTLLKHLYVFSFMIPVVIDEILERGSYTVSQIVNCNYIQTQIPFLSDKEQELLYLKISELYQNQLSDVYTPNPLNQQIKQKIKI